MTSSIQSVVDRLKEWSSCDVSLQHTVPESTKTGGHTLNIQNYFFYQISDGLRKLGHTNGGFLEGLELYSPEFQRGKSRLVGPAFTVKFAPISDSAAPKLVGSYVSEVLPHENLTVSADYPYFRSTKFPKMLLFLSLNHYHMSMPVTAG